MKRASFLFWALIDPVYLAGRGLAKALHVATGSLDADHRNDPAYQAKLQQLIERGRIIDGTNEPDKH